MSYKISMQDIIHTPPPSTMKKVKYDEARAFWEKPMASPIQPTIVPEPATKDTACQTEITWLKNGDMRNIYKDYQYPSWMGPRVPFN